MVLFILYSLLFPLLMLILYSSFSLPCPHFMNLVRLSLHYVKAFSHLAHVSSVSLARLTNIRYLFIFLVIKLFLLEAFELQESPRFYYSNNGSFIYLNQVHKFLSSRFFPIMRLEQSTLFQLTTLSSIHFTNKSLKMESTIDMQF